MELMELNITIGRLNSFKPFQNEPTTNNQQQEQFETVPYNKMVIK